MKLKNKIALITGSSRGIGRATALLFAREGAKIVVNYLNSKKEAEEVVKQIKEIGSDAVAIKCDVSKEQEVKKMVEETTKKFGGIDILVNNAGVVYDIPFKERTIEQWKKTLEINLIGCFLCAKYTAIRMPTNGSMVLVSSTSGTDNFDPGSIDYNSSKSGVITLARTLAKQLAPIRVNCIAPGWVDTDMNKNLPGEFVKQEMEKIYLKRMATPDEIAKAILFLVSDDSSYITGSILKIDGGYG